MNKKNREQEAEHCRLILWINSTANRILIELYFSVLYFHFLIKMGSYFIVSVAAP